MTAQSTAPQTYRAAKSWRRDGGLYLGWRGEGVTGNRAFPLDRNYSWPKAEAGAEIKSHWLLGGGRCRYVGEAHAHTIAPNGSGKSRKVILPNLFRLVNWSCAVIDPKGEHAAHTLLWRTRHGNTCRVIDPFGVIPATYPRLYEKYPELFKSRGFNPLARCKLKAANENARDYLVDDVSDIARALIKADDKRESYWTNAARALVKGLGLALVADTEGPPTLNHLRMILGRKPETLAGYIRDTIANHGKAHPEITANLSEFAEHTKEDREQAGIRRTAKTETEWLDSPFIQRDLGGQDFDFRTLKTTPTTIYIVLPPKMLKKYSVWLRLLITAILQPLMESTEDWDVPTLLMLDEISQLGRMEIIHDYYPMFRQYGVKLWAFWQSIEQMKIYGDTWGDLIANAGIVQSFAPNDTETREYLSKLAGERQRRYITRTTSKSTSSGTSDGWSSHGGSGGTNSGTSTTNGTNTQIMVERVIKPLEIASLDKDETIVINRGGVTLAACPQPFAIPRVREALAAARAEIEGRSSEPSALAASGAEAAPAA